MAIKAGDSGDEGVVGQINVVPLIDVLFSILTFFVLASIFLTKQQGLSLALPKAKASETRQFKDQVTVSVTKDGQYFLNKNPVDVKNIAPEIKDQIEANPDKLVVIAADRQVKYKYVLAVLDELRQVNASKLAMATESE
jgi:biopolymer transport protein ExbD